MSIIKTSTPTYNGQATSSTVQRSPRAKDWFMSLFRTPTPAYQTLPPDEPGDSPGQPEQAPDEGNRTHNARL